MEAGDFQKLAIKQYPPRSIRETAEGKFWKAFRSPSLTQQVGPVSSIDFSPVAPHDFAITSSTRVIVYDGVLRKPKKTISRFRDIAYSGTFRPDGQLLVAGGETGVVQVFDPGSRAVLRQLKGHSSAVHFARYAPDKTHIASGGDDGTVRYWDSPAQAQLLCLEGHSDYVRCGAVSPANADVWATGAYDHTVRLWDVRTGAAVLRLDHGQPLEALAFFPSGGLLVSAGGNYLSVWDVLGGGRLLRRVSNHQKTITSVLLATARGATFGGGAAAPRLLSASLDGHVKVYDVNDFKVTHASRYPAPVLSLGLSPSCTTLAVGMTNGLLSIRVRDSLRSAAGAPVGRGGRGMLGLRPKARRRQRQLQPGTYRYFLRGQAAGAPADAVVLPRARGPRLAAHDKLLRRFQYREALDAALQGGRPEVVFSVMEDLVARHGLCSALAGRDAAALQPLLVFLVRYVVHPRYARLLLRVAHKLLDLYAPALGRAPQVDTQMALLRERVLVELRLQQNLAALRGLLQPVIAASITAGP